jgi:hypothetical protein
MGLTPKRNQRDCNAASQAGSIAQETKSRKLNETHGQGGRI